VGCNFRVSSRRRHEDDVPRNQRPQSGRTGAASMTMPRRAKTKPSLADSAQSRVSIDSVMVSPKPTAEPLIAATSGLGLAKIRSVTAPPPSRSASNGRPANGPRRATNCTDRVEE
jgi:hypothetical protein